MAILLSSNYAVGTDFPWLFLDSYGLSSGATSCIFRKSCDRSLHGPGSGNFEEARWLCYCKAMPVIVPERFLITPPFLSYLCSTVFRKRISNCGHLRYRIIPLRHDFEVLPGRRLRRVHHSTAQHNWQPGLSQLQQINKGPQQKQSNLPPAAPFAVL